MDQKLLVFLLGAALASSLSVPTLAGAPYDCKASPFEGETAAQLDFLGYRCADGGLLDADGKAVSAEKAADFARPFSAKATPVGEGLATSVLSMGLRLDDAGDRVLNPYTLAPLSNLEVEYLLRYAVLEARPLVLENMLRLLSPQKPGAAVPRDVRRQLSTLSKVEQGMVSEKLERMLKDDSLNAGALARGVEQSYADAVRFWDAARPLSDLKAAALPPDPKRPSFAAPIVLRGWDRSRTPPALLTKDESSLSGLLQASIAKRLSANPVSRELLSHFPKAKGKPVLPPILLLDAGDPRMAACYNPAADAVVVNLGAFSARKPLPAGMSMPQYLRAHPEEVAEFVRLHAAELDHELTHAWQSHRASLTHEQYRGNAPLVNAIEQEHEAFLHHALFLHAEFLKDPAGAQANPRFADYLALLAGFDEYRDDITRRYLRSWPANAATLKTALELQKIREDAARRRLAAEPKESERQTLKLQGLALGTKSLENALAEHEARMKDFAAKEYPRVRTEALAGLRSFALALEKKAQWDQALAALRVARALAPRLSAEEGRKAEEESKALADRTLAWLAKSAPKPPFDPRLKTLSALESQYLETRAPVPAAFAEQKAKVYRLAAREQLERAKGEKDRSARDKALSLALSWARAVKDSALCEEIERLRGAP
ncbi:MAG: hypothetical protein WC969_00485 [Elusimicrobiota bacterium]